VTVLEYTGPQDSVPQERTVDRVCGSPCKVLETVEQRNVGHANCITDGRFRHTASGEVVQTIDWLPPRTDLLENWR
jgi:hypothetical protein